MYLPDTAIISDAKMLKSPMDGTDIVSRIKSNRLKIKTYVRNLSLNMPENNVALATICRIAVNTRYDAVFRIHCHLSQMTQSLLSLLMNITAVRVCVALHMQVFGCNRLCFPVTFCHAKLVIKEIQIADCAALNIFYDLNFALSRYIRRYKCAVRDHLHSSYQTLLYTLTDYIHKYFSEEAIVNESPTPILTEC
jgi:hypothetical protein